MGLSLQFESHHPRGSVYWGELGLDHKGTLIVKLFLGRHSEQLRPVERVSNSRWTPPLHQISDGQFLSRGLLHWPLPTILAWSQTDTMPPLFSEQSFGPLREDQGWEWGWGERFGRSRRRRGCGLSKVSWSMISEHLEIYSKCLSWLEKQQ